MNKTTSLDIQFPSARESSEFSATHAVVEAVADARGVSPVDLHPPLYSAVDTDALDRFVDSHPDRSAGEGVRIQFRYCGFEVTVAGDGEVSLDARDADR